MFTNGKRDVPDGTWCPRIDAPCIERKCKFWISMRGVNENTGQQVDQYNCADVWRVLLAIEGNKEARETAAAVESFRNETVRASDRLARAVAAPTTVEGRTEQLLPPRY